MKTEMILAGLGKENMRSINKIPIILLSDVILYADLVEKRKHSQILQSYFPSPIILKN